MAALRVPLFTVLMVAGALAVEAREAAVLIGLAGWGIHGLWRGLTIEVSGAGLTRGLVLKGGFVGRTTVIGWRTIEDVHTDWCRPGDDSALETTVRARDGATIRISTIMGLGAYWACLTDIVRHAPPTTATGLTAATLAEAPPARRDVLSAAAPAAALGLIIVAVVLLHYVWAQGPSTPARQPEQTGALSAPR
jgi:hypothetical protein